MAKLPVWRQNESGVYLPLWIERTGGIQPAWSEDPCDQDCCGEVVSACSCCEAAPNTKLITVSGIAEPPGACPDPETDCTQFNGVYAATKVTDCSWQFQDLNVTISACGTPFAVDFYASYLKECSTGKVTIQFKVEPAGGGIAFAFILHEEVMEGCGALSGRTQTAGSCLMTNANIAA